MAIVAGFDVHRAQITFDALNRGTGEVERGRPGGVGRADDVDLVARALAGLACVGAVVDAPPGQLGHAGRGTAMPRSLWQ